MGVTIIVDRHLKINITDKGLQEALAPLNTNGDDKIDINDFEMANPKAAVPESVRREAMHHAIVDVFIKNGAINKNEAKGMLRFFDLYNDVKIANRLVQKWMKNVTDTTWRSHEFSAEFWISDILLHVTGDGVLSRFGRHFTPIGSYLAHNGPTGSIGLGLSAELYYVISHLANTPVNHVSRRLASNRWTYQADKIPPIIDEHVRDLVWWWQSIDSFLKGYRRVECDGDGCPEADTFYWVLIDIKPR